MRFFVLAALCSAICASAQTDGYALSRQANTLFYIEGDLDGAEAAFTKLSKMTGDFRLEGVNGLYSVLERRKKPMEGVQLFHEHYAKTGDLQYLALAGLRLAEGGFTYEANKELEPLEARIKKGEKLNPRVLASIAYAQRSLNNLEPALQAAKLAEDAFRVQGSPQWVVLGNLAADLLEDSGRTLEAFNEFEFLLDGAPDNATILNNYAYHLAVHNKDMERALQLSKKSDVLDPNSAPILDTLGFILFKMGRYQEAARAIGRSLRIRPDEMVVRTHMAQAIMKRSGKQSKTLEQLLDMLRSEPTPENNLRLPELLDSAGE